MVASFNFDRLQRRADSLIARFGGGSGLGTLRRDGIDDRVVSCVLTEYTPHEKELRLEGSRRALVSRFDPDTGAPLALPPNHELDKLVFAGEVLRIVSPDTGIRPNGTPIFHDLEVVYDSRDV
jgi:hypothetical protein